MECGKATSCVSRYHLNTAVECYVTGSHALHEGFYLLAGRVVTWTDADKRPEPVEEPEPRTAMQEAFERATQKDCSATRSKGR